MTLKGALVVAGLVIGVGWLWGRRTTAAPVLTIEEQLASIWSVFVDAWVYRGGAWLVYAKDGSFREFTSINMGETVWLQVTSPVTLTYRKMSVPLVPDGNINDVLWNP